MWAQEWQNLYDIMIPYKSKTNVDVTPQMVAQVGQTTMMYSDLQFNSKFIINPVFYLLFFFCHCTLANQEVTFFYLNQSVEKIIIGLAVFNIGPIFVVVLTISKI
jgi:hypothetical protein